MNWKLKETEEFEKQFDKLSDDIQFRFRKQFKKVEQNPYALGKPLGYNWFRELKNEGFRVYYLVYDQKVIVLFVGASGKKSQKSAISSIKYNFGLFKEIAENESKIL